MDNRDIINDSSLAAEPTNPGPHEARAWDEAIDWDLLKIVDYIGSGIPEALETAIRDEFYALRVGDLADPGDSYDQD